MGAVISYLMNYAIIITACIISSSPPVSQQQIHRRRKSSILIQTKRKISCVELHITQDEYGQMQAASGEINIVQEDIITYSDDDENDDNCSVDSITSDDLQEILLSYKFPLKFTASSSSEEDSSVDCCGGGGEYQPTIDDNTEYDNITTSKNVSHGNNKKRRSTVSFELRLNEIEIPTRRNTINLDQQQQQYTLEHFCGTQTASLIYS
jgi:hypothetical protein